MTSRFQITDTSSVLYDGQHRPVTPFPARAALVGDVLVTIVGGASFFRVLEVESTPDTVSLVVEGQDRSRTDLVLDPGQVLYRIGNAPVPRIFR